MSKVRKSKYEGRLFTIIGNPTKVAYSPAKNSREKAAKEVVSLLPDLAYMAFSYNQFIDYREDRERARPGYRSRGGSDYARELAGKSFSHLRKHGFIAEIVA